MKKISIITIAHGTIGMGHVVRCLALADMLCQNFVIEFIVETDQQKIIDLINGKGYGFNQIAGNATVSDLKHILPHLSHTSIVITDFYDLTEEYQQGIKKLKIKLVCIDDLHSMHFYADVVLNASNSVKESNYSTETYTRLLLGSKYVLLRPDFLCEDDLTDVELLSKDCTVFLNMGGADVFNNSQKFLVAVSKVQGVRRIHVVLGHLYENFNKISRVAKDIKSCRVYLHKQLTETQLRGLLSRCTAAICPASGIAIEVCASRIPLISGYTADNQKSNLDGLVNTGCAVSLGNFNTIYEEDITRFVTEIVRDTKQQLKMVLNQKTLIDKKSACRIRSIFEGL